MKTADSIEQAKSVKAPTIPPSKRQHPNSLKNLRPPWKPGECPNPGGRQKNDVAAILARAVLEASMDVAFKGFVKQLAKGNAYVFKELAERGYGKLKEQREVTHIHQDVADADLNQRIAQLERDLGLAGAIDEAGRTGLTQAGTTKANGKSQDPAILSR